MKIIRIDRIGEYERRLEVEFDGDDPSQFRRAAGLVLEAEDITHISTHVPREGHDASGLTVGMLSGAFLSTCPVRGTTCCWAIASNGCVISIHVPREGHDPSSPALWGWRCHFYPRAP